MVEELSAETGRDRIKAPGLPGRIGDAREYAGLNAAELGRRVGVVFGRDKGIDGSTIGRYESGENEPTAGPLLGIALACGVSPVWLLTGEGLMPWTPGEGAKVDQERLLEALRLLMEYLERESAEGRYVAEVLAVEQGVIEPGELSGRDDAQGSRPDAASG